MRRFLLFLLLIFLLPTVSAQFLAYGDTVIEGKPCQVLTHNLTIQNTKAYPANYALSVGGEGADLVTFSQIAFSLQPQETIAIANFYSIPCEAAPGTYPVSIYFDDGEDELELYQEVNVKVDPTIVIETGQASQVITPCGQAEYQLTLSNPSNMTDVFTLSAAGHKDAIVSPTTIVLLPNQTRQASVKVEPEDCTEAGTFPLTLTAESEKTSQQESLEIELFITSSDIAQIAEEISKIKTDYNDSTAELPIRNIGDRTTTYSISVDGPEWATIAPATITLSPNEEGTLNLRFRPEGSTPEGNYDVEVSATVDQTGVIYSKQITVSLSRPGIIQKNPVVFAIIIIVLILILFLTSGLLIYSRTETYKRRKALKKERKEQKRKQREERRQKLIEKRKARREARRKAKEEAKARKEAQKKKKEKEEEREKARKEKAEAKKAKLKLKVEKEFKKKYHFVPKDDIVIGKTKSRLKHYFILIFLVMLLILTTAFWSFIEPNLLYIGIGIILLAALYIVRKIFRATRAKARWKLIAKDQKKTIKVWNKGLRELTVQPEKTTKYYQIEVIKRSSRNVPAKAVYATFSIIQNAEAKLTGTIAVSKRWLQRKGLSADTIKLGKFRGHSWRKTDFTKKGEDQNFIFLTAELGEGTYSIYGTPAETKAVKKPKAEKKAKKAKPRKPMSRNAILTTGIVLIAILTGLAVWLINPVTVEGAIPPQTWKQDTVHKLYLADYFSDPDGDQLTYSANPTEHITIDFIENTAIFTPEKGFAGEEIIKITATDDKGASVTSNSIPLRVKEVIVPTQLQPITAAILAILAVAVLIWMALKLRKTKK